MRRKHYFCNFYSHTPLVYIEGCRRGHGNWTVLYCCFGASISDVCIRAGIKGGTQGSLLSRSAEQLRRSIRGRDRRSYSCDAGSRRVGIRSYLSNRKRKLRQLGQSGLVPLMRRVAAASRRMPVVGPHHPNQRTAQHVLVLPASRKLAREKCSRWRLLSSNALKPAEAEQMFVRALARKEKALGPEPHLDPFDRQQSRDAVS